jgi:IS5 family transposase
MARTPRPTYTLDTIYSQLEGIEAIVLRTVSDQPTLWDAILPSELLVLPAELARVDALLDDPVFFAPFAAYFDARIGRPSIPVETYLRLMFLKFRYRLGYELLCHCPSPVARLEGGKPNPARLEDRLARWPCARLSLTYSEHLWIGVRGSPTRFARRTCRASRRNSPTRGAPGIGPSSPRSITARGHGATSMSFTL